MHKLNTPFLLLAFNRAETTNKVFEEIRKAKPKKFYFFVDAPRLNNENDLINSELIKNLTKKIDWECELFTNFPSQNLGCGLGVSSAISWAFEREDRLIILEDDCVPAQSFFYYCDVLLEKYKNDERIGIISGNQYNEEDVIGNNTYFFSKYGHTWGWATWKRCWDKMDMDMNDFDSFLKNNMFDSVFKTKHENIFFKKVYKKFYEDPNKYHTWDYQLGYILFKNNYLSIVPTKNLVKNIGYIGAHSKNISRFHNRPVDESYKIEKHPIFFLVNQDYEKKHFKKHWKKMKSSLITRILNKLKTLINFNGK